MHSAGRFDSFSIRFANIAHSSLLFDDVILPPTITEEYESRHRNVEAVRYATTRCILRDSLQTRPGRLLSYAKVGASSCHENVRTIRQNRIVSSRITSYLDRKQRRRRTTTTTGRTSPRRSRAGHTSPPSASWPVSRRCSSLSSSAINEDATDGLLYVGITCSEKDSEGSLAHLVTHVSCAQNRRERTHLTKDGEHSPLFVHQP